MSVVLWRVFFLREYLQKQVGEVLVEKTIAVKSEKCSRCGADKEMIVIDALGRYACRDCGSNSDMILYRYRQRLPLVEHRLDLNLQLTKWQKRGSEFIIRCYLSHAHGFLQAVCGAGKTEMTLAAICLALNRHIRVGFAIPRKQVVIQLSERIKKYFPSSNVKAIHAEAKNDRDAHIVVMTIQQLVNYKDEFGLLLIDEVDAFPFADSPFYWRLANQALRAGGSLILISATLTSALKRKLTKSGFRFHFNPARFHGVDHDLPRFLQLSGSALETILESILPILKKWRLDSKRAILFLPSIAKCLAFASLLRKEGVKARAVTSETERKEAIIHEFSAGNLDVLVSTSILERGITFSGIQIAVLQADSPLYDRDTLIQMSGRVGRDLWEPRGEIWFLSEYLSPAMRKARAEIRMLNRRKNLGGD
jgi:competence protein ComFA